MRKAFLVLIIFFMLANLSGCTGRGGPREQVEGVTETEQLEMVVERYLESAAAGDWQAAMNELSGEALAEAGVNAGRVKNKEKIVSKKIEAGMVTASTAQVVADVTKAAEGFIDRVPYRFSLVKTESGWKIYKTEWAAYIHGELESYPLPADAEETIRSYVESPISKRRTNDRLYLAGRLLSDSMKSKLLPKDGDMEAEGVTEKVKIVECLGRTEDYAVVRVYTELNRGGKSYDVQSIFELVCVNGTWKISGLDVAGIEGV